MGRRASVCDGPHSSSRVITSAGRPVLKAGPSLRVSVRLTPRLRGCSYSWQLFSIKVPPTSRDRQLIDCLNHLVELKQVGVTCNGGVLTRDGLAVLHWFEVPAVPCIMQAFKQPPWGTPRTASRLSPPPAAPSRPDRRHQGGTLGLRGPTGIATATPREATAAGTGTPSTTRWG